MIEHTTNLVGQSGSSLRRAGVSVRSEYTDVPGGSVRIKAAAIAGAIAACPSLVAAQPAKPLVPALTSEQIQASQALAPKYDRSASMEQARQATFKDRPLGAIVQKSFNAFANFLIVSAQMMPEPGYGFRPTPDVRTFGEQINHATGANYSFCNQVGVPVGFERRTPPSLQTAMTKAAIVKALEDSIAYCSSLLAAASEAWLMEPAPNLGGTGSGVITGPRAYAYIYAGIHTAEDYGTITTYLRMQGLVPPSTALNPPGRGGAPAGAEGRGKPQ